jgi:uroporphyrinogen III methyltransferase/synthase
MNKGFVALIGAGPGDKGLLTLKGAELLSKAEVVVFDRLVSQEILEMIPDSSEKIDVGKESGHHKVPQSEINQILLDKALEGKFVIRLKGGDPFLFGRGAEELELLVENNIEFEVVPGITSALSVPAYAGIPVSHRDFCSSVHIITGHARQDGQLEIDFESLGRLSGTLVFLMGVSSLEYIMSGLQNAGMRTDMPAAVIENGTRPTQRKIVSTISELWAKAAENNIHSPAIIVVGEVCLLSDKFDWFTKRSLFGKKIAVTRPNASISALSNKLRSLGADVIEYPCIEVMEIAENHPLEEAICNIKQYGWLVFTSKNGAKIFFGKLRKMKLDSRHLGGLKIAAIGNQTAEALKNYRLIADYLPTVFDSIHLALGLSTLIKNGEKVLICRASSGSEELCEILKEKGIAFDDIAVYDTVYTNPESAALKRTLETGQVDFVTFTSVSTVEGFVRSVGNMDYSTVTGICIGDKTAEAVKKYGIRHYVAQQATTDSMITKMMEVSDECKRQ